MSGTLLERVQSLKEKLDELGVAGADDRELFELRSRVARLSLALVVSDLEEEDPSYVEATRAVDEAIASIDVANDEVSSVAAAIRVAAQGVAAAEKAIALVP